VTLPMAVATNEERVVESVERAWVLDGPDHPLARLTGDEIRTARQPSRIARWWTTARLRPRRSQTTSGRRRAQVAVARQTVLI
jgi:hypothetical protein